MSISEKLLVKIQHSVGKTVRIVKCAFCRKIDLSTTIDIEPTRFFCSRKCRLAYKKWEKEDIANQK